MKSKGSVLILLAVLVFPWEVSGEQVADQNEVLKILNKASEANRSLLHYGRVHASIRRISYDEKGQKSREAVYDIRAVFKGETIRLDKKEPGGNREKTWRAVATQEEFKEYSTGERDAYLREAKMAEMLYPYAGFLPSRNSAFWHSFLGCADDDFSSRTIIEKDVSDQKVYILDIVYKKYPKDLGRYHLDPAKGGSVLKFESFHDFGKGYILLRQDEAEMQPTQEGGWYLKRFSSMGYRPDGTLRRKEEIEIKSCDFSFDVLDAEFTWEAMGLPKGTKINDKRLNISYEYGGPSDPARKRSGETVETQQEIPEVAKVLLAGIKDGKKTRQIWRNLYALMNKPAPDIDVAKWIQSEPLQLAGLRGKVIVLDFWAIDCGPCLGDIEGLNKIHERGNAEPVVVIGVHSPTGDIGEVERVMAKYKVKYHVCIDSGGGSKEYWGGQTFQRYGVNAIPRPFLIDIKGNVRSVASPVELPMLEKLIKESADGVTGVSPSEPGWIVGVKVAPEKISFGVVSTGQKVQKSVYIYKPDDPTFKVNIVSHPDKPTTAQLFKYQDEETFLYEIKILITGGLQKTNYASQIKLTTNDTRTPEILIPVTASVASGEP